MSSNLTYSESEVQSLKAQEAKDYCLELMRLVTAREEGPISPGEVQLEELRYELEVKEAEAEDNRQREAHVERVKELELEIEREKAELAKSQQLADERREQYARVISQVAQSQEKLSVQLDRATREHNVKLQIMHSEHAARSEALQAELEGLTARRDALIDEIGKLADLNSAAEDVDRLRLDIEEKRIAAVREHKQLDESIEMATFEKEKDLKRVRREQELALAELDAAHRKQLLDAKTEALEAMLKSLGYAKINPAELLQLKAQAAEHRELTEQEVLATREVAVAEFKRQFNVNTTEPLDVTDLFYRERALQEDNAAYQQQIQ